MKHLIRLSRARRTFLGILTLLAITTLAGSALVNRAQGAGGPRHEGEGEGEPLAQEAQILQLLSNYHGALANGGNIDAMASLWADDGTLTLNNGTPFVGKAAVVNFFATGPYFTHNWVSLAPEWKTTLNVHGQTAEATTECIATDVSVTPNVIRGVIQVNATCEKRDGKWVFIQMTNFSLPQL